MSDFNTDRLWNRLVLLDRRTMPPRMSYWDELAQAFTGIAGADGVLYEQTTEGLAFVLTSEGNVIGDT